MENPIDPETQRHNEEYTRLLDLNFKNLANNSQIPFDQLHVLAYQNTVTQMMSENIRNNETVIKGPISKGPTT